MGKLFKRYFIPIFFVVTLLLCFSKTPAVSVRAATPITFTAEELLTRPTDTSININVIPASAIELYYDYKVSGGTTYSSTSVVSAAAGAPNNVVIGGLGPDTKYYYHMHYHLPGETDWVTRSEHSFHTRRDADDTFTFIVTSDTHSGLGGNFFSAARYNQTLGHMLADQPDFWIDTGDTPKDDFLSGQAAYEDGYKNFRGLIKAVSGDIPFFQVLGNHEQEVGWSLDDEISPLDTQPIQAANARRLIFPNPKPDGFYTGNTDTSLTYINDDHLREDYYAWTWGDALFIALDPYWYTMKFPQENSTYPFGGEENQPGEEATKGTRWDWSLGIQQYLWLKNTLETSTSAYKFIFIHNVTGGIIPYGRGGTEIAGYFEWGGKNWDDTWGWDTHRPAAAGWTVPVHQLMDQYNVTIFFHGHDHFYAKQELDGIVYQEVPMPAAIDNFAGFRDEQTGTYASQYPPTSRMLFYGDATKYTDSGHLRVTVSPAEVTVDYVRMNGAVTGSYTIPGPTTNVAPLATDDTFTTYTGTVLNAPAPGVLENDDDPNSDPLTAILVSGPTNGVLVLNPDGSFAYNPTAGFTGQDSFTYKANDGSLDGNTATVTIHVNAAAQSIPLASGWNLVSFNIHPASTLIADLLTSIAGNYNLVYAWDAGGAGSWLKYDPAMQPLSLNSLQTLDESRGFWIWMTSAGTLEITGTAPVKNISLSATAGGWNLVGYPSGVAHSLPEALSQHGVGSDFTMIYAYHAGDSDGWKKFDPAVIPVSLNDLPELAPGWGYWIKVSLEHVWNVP